MKIRVNNAEMALHDGNTVRALITLTKSPMEGIAIAVNDSVVPRSQWDSFIIKENDDILIIKAARGG